MLSRIAVSSLLLSLTACNTNPCGDASGDLPMQMAGFPLVHAGGEVCHGDGGDDDSAFATITYWGDDTQELKETYTVGFTSEGWSLVPCDAPPQADGVDRLCFESDRSRVELHVEQTETGRLGGAFAAPSMRVSAYWTPRR
jgi:hypothetical protein